MSFFNKTESSLGVDIGAGGIKLVELRKTKGRPQLWTYALVDEMLDIHIPREEEINGAPVTEGQKNIAAKAAPKDAMGTAMAPADQRVQKYAQLLKLAVEQARVESRRATASLPVSAVFHAVITLPKVPEREIEHHVMAKAKKILPRPIEEMQVVHQALPTDPKNKQEDIRVLVTAAPKTLIQFYTQIFQAAGLQLEELETEAFALERALVGRDKATAMIVDIGFERTNFFIIDDGLPMTHRSIQLGGRAFNAVLAQYTGLDPALIDTVKADVSRISPDRLPAEMFMSLLDPIVKEIQSGFDLYLRQTGNQAKRPEKIIFTGGGSLFPVIIPTVARSFPLRVFLGDPWARVVYQQDLKPMLDVYGPRMSVTIGLALRHIVDNGRARADAKMKA